MKDFYIKFIKLKITSIRKYIINVESRGTLMCFCNLKVHFFQRAYAFSLQLNYALDWALACIQMKSIY